MSHGLIVIVAIRCSTFERPPTVLERLTETIPTYVAGYPIHLGTSDRGGIRTLCGMPGAVSVQFVDCPGCQLQARVVIDLAASSLRRLAAQVREAVKDACRLIRELREGSYRVGECDGCHRTETLRVYRDEEGREEQALCLRYCEGRV